MSIFAILGYILVLFFVAVNLGGFHGFYMFNNLPSLVFTITVLLLTLWGTGTARDFMNGLKIGLHLKKSYSTLDLKKSDEALHLIMKTIITFSCINGLMSMVSLLYHMSDPLTIGPVIATGLLSLLYSLIIALILTPFKARIHMLLIAYAEDNRSREEELTEESLDQRTYYLLRSKGLTDREAEIARLVGLELTNRQIAGRLFITEATVKKHVTHILEKLQLTGRDSIIEMLQDAVQSSSTAGSDSNITV